MLSHRDSYLEEDVTQAFRNVCRNTPVDVAGKPFAPRFSDRDDVTELPSSVLGELAHVSTLLFGTVIDLHAEWHG